jgi:hypothetical protein
MKRMDREQDCVLQLSGACQPRYLSERENAGCEPISKVCRHRLATEEKKRTQEGYIEGTILKRQQKTPCVTKGFLAPRAGLEPLAISRIRSNSTHSQILEFYEFHMFHELHGQGYNYGTATSERTTHALGPQRGLCHH